MKRVLLAACFLLVGCGQTTSYAVPLTSDAVSPNLGPIAIWATREPVGKELGIVEARGFGDDGTIDHLIPELSRRARALGADAVTVDFIGLSLERIPRIIDVPPVCGPPGCTPQGPLLTDQEVVSVRVRGRAFRTQGAGATP
jgi:hypothetical protein